MFRTIIAVTALMYFSSFTLADQWGQWRGPHGNGSTAGTPPVHWSSNKNVKWQVEIPGGGSGSPVVWDDQVFAVTSVPGEKNPQELQFLVYSFDRKTGKTLWSRTATRAIPHQETHNTNTHASASPCTDGQHVYAHFGSRGLYCYTMNGELKWKREFGRMQTRNGFGEGSSPTIEGNMLLVPWDHEGQSALYALNKLTGETIWEAKRDEPTCWATPLVVDTVARSKLS